MSEAWNRGDEARRAAAADWLVRLQAHDLDEAEALAFDAWLAAHPANAAAYDATLSIALEFEASAAGIADALAAAPARRPSRPMSRTARRGWLVAGGLAAAATVAIAVMPFGGFQTATQTYATAKGEHRSVKLADGSAIDLNAASSLSVRLGAQDRRVVMAEGEAVFDVAADKARPFLIAAGDRTVRVVGTRFDVRRRAGLLSVTVERGVVEVQPSEGAAGRTFRLHPGQRLDHLEGAASVQVSAADPQQVFSWKSGRLIYRDQPLGDVVADLNQQFARPIVIGDPTLAQIRVSGVLVLDDQAAVIRRLALLAPIKALPSGDGIVLRSDPAAKP
ncbi:FecR family protein [Phenylobacterium sp.]|uniref:FecR family protein n=1 Tax=Phenylobacterium sp. TaxID=1871053 RepID=UPI003567E716